MAQLEFSAEETIKCSPERAFDYFADHRHVAAVVEGKIDPQRAGAPPAVADGHADEAGF